MAVLCCGMPQSRAAGRATEILEKLAAGFRAMPGSSVDFEVSAGDYKSRGSYVVEGRYYLVLADAEVFADERGPLRNRQPPPRGDRDGGGRREPQYPEQSRPGFRFSRQRVYAVVGLRSRGRAVVRLTPAAGNDSPVGDVTLTVDTAAMRPLSLSYDYDGEQVLVNVWRSRRSLGNVRLFDRKTMRVTNSLISADRVRRGIAASRVCVVRIFGWNGRGVGPSEVLLQDSIPAWAMLESELPFHFDRAVRSRGRILIFPV